MKVIATFLLLVGFGLDIAAKCDSYFVGNVIYRRRGHGVDQDDRAIIEGCKKGCFWNETYTDDGIPKCAKCKEITDEKECLSHAATCKWTKSGKCRSQSCPGIAKARLTLNTYPAAEAAGDENDTGGGPILLGAEYLGAEALGFGGINDNRTKESQFKYQARKEQECIEGSALEQKYNRIYWDDYYATYNHDYPVWNSNDTCTSPGSKTGSSYPYGWKKTNEDGTYKTQNENKASCSKYHGHKYIPDKSVPNPIPANDDCRLCVVLESDVTAPLSPAKFEAACLAMNVCRYSRGSSDDGFGDSGTASPDSCLVNNAGYCSSGFFPGASTKENCENGRNGCVYLKGKNVFQGKRYVRNTTSDLSPSDTCVPGCGSTFVAGSIDSRKLCEELGCTYSGGDESESRGIRPNKNLKTFEEITTCPPERHFPSDAYPGHNETWFDSCGINITLGLGYSDHLQEACDDRIYDPSNSDSATCSVGSFTSEETCRSGRGTWSPPTAKNCRKLSSTVRSECLFEWRNATMEVVWKNITAHGGNQRPGTRKEKCIQDGYDAEDPDDFYLEKVVGYDGVERNLTRYLYDPSVPGNFSNYYGYSSPEEYCEHYIQLKEQACQQTYDASVALCHSNATNADNQISSAYWTRSSIQIKAARSACHRIYGCMYSKSNERCSYWSVWAFILTLILTFVVFFVALGVGAVFVLPILKRSAA